MGACAVPGPDRALREGFGRAGKALDMGQSCLRFRAADDLALDVIAAVIASTPPDALIARYEAARAGRGSASRPKTPSRTRTPSRSGRATAKARRPSRR